MPPAHCRRPPQVWKPGPRPPHCPDPHRVAAKSANCNDLCPERAADACGSAVRCGAAPVVRGARLGDERRPGRRYRGHRQSSPGRSASSLPRPGARRVLARRIQACRNGQYANHRSPAIFCPCTARSQSTRGAGVSNGPTSSCASSARARVACAGTDGAPTGPMIRIWTVLRPSRSTAPPAPSASSGRAPYRAAASPSCADDGAGRPRPALAERPLDRRWNRAAALGGKGHERSRPSFRHGEL